MVPILPGFAMGMIDQDEASNDLFGGNENVILRWENVYYKTKSHHRMLRSPGRIFWYVSDSKKAVIGVSYLDEVECAKPKSFSKNINDLGF